MKQRRVHTLFDADDGEDNRPRVLDFGDGIDDDDLDRAVSGTIFYILKCISY